MSGRISADGPSVSGYDTTWVRKVTRASVLELLVADAGLGKERVDIRIKPGFRTACWLFIPPHRIYIGDGIPERARGGLTEAQIARYVKAHVRHEIAHGHWTDRDLRALTRDLGDIAPFGLFNLFEDARIEHKYRSAHATPFEWTEFEDISITAEDPIGIFYAMIQHDANEERVRSAAREREVPEKRVTEVVPYFRNALAAKDSRALFPVLQAWVKRFGSASPPAQVQGRPDGFAVDLSLSLELQTDPDKLHQFDGDAVSATGAILDGKQKSSDQSGRVDVESFAGNADLLAEKTCELLDEAQVQRLSERLQLVFSSKARDVLTLSPSRRIYIRNFVLGGPFYRAREIQTPQRRKVLLVVDCSASMAGSHIEQARLLVAAYSELARRNIVTGHVVLSAVVGRQACWQRFALPIRVETIGRIQAFGDAEGLEFALKSNLKEAQAADHVAVYSDGDIFDQPIERRTLHARGVYIWGLYAGESEQAVNDLLRYFDRALVRSNVEGLVEAMLLYS